MKKGIIIFAAALALNSCTSNEAGSTEERKAEYAEYVDEPTRIQFKEPVFDFGTVEEGVEVVHTWEFTNVGEQNLVLFDVSASCGCTVPEDWPKNPIAPGETGKIEVKFNSTNRVGLVQKKITVEANTEKTSTFLTLKGVVEEAK